MKNLVYLPKRAYNHTVEGVLRMRYTFLATAAFGLEGVIKQELTRLGLDAKAEQGAVRFEATPEQAFMANLWLRAADRVLLLVGEREATGFDALFEFVKSLPWDDFLPRDARFPVSGRCARSQLMSVRDCQAITKKAIVEKMKAAYHTERFPETGETYQVDVAVHGNIARITLDTSGDALNRRGYRTWNGEAPIRETLAAALVMLSRYRGERPLYDPCCGTGTLLIEAAFIQSCRAPGLARAFSIERWPLLDQNEAAKLRTQAKEAFKPELIHDIAGSDIDPAALALCQKHIAQAGLTGRIQTAQIDFRDLTLPYAPFFLANPPYGERMGERKNAEMLYKYLGRLYKRHAGAAMGVITSHMGFERCAGLHADARRRLYNGRLECEFLLFGLKKQRDF